MGSVIAALRFLHNAKTFEPGNENQSVAIPGNAKHTISSCVPQTAVILSPLPLFFGICKGHSGCSITTSSKNFKYLALASRQTGWKEERDAHEPLPAAMWLSESNPMNHSEWGENTTECFLIQNIAQCFQGLFHPPSRSLARAGVANYHQVSNGKNSSDAFRVHTSKDMRQCG